MSLNNIYDFIRLGRSYMPAGKVSILIPTMFDSRYIIELCIKSIKKNTDYSDYKIIVCDNGADSETRQYLQRLTTEGEIQLIETTDWKRPKDDLVKAVDTEYYVIMHDDIRILRKDWLRKRMALMAKNPSNAIVGTVLKNYSKTKRFFPLGILVKAEVSRKLDLKWGKYPEKGFDTGAIAYNKFFSQDKFKFVPYKTTRDIYHFACMTWPKYNTEENCPGVTKKVKERDEKIKLIRDILNKGTF